MNEHVLPVPHPGGTSRDRLVEPICEAALDVRRAVASLKEAGPHGRDYPVEGTFAKAEAQHVSRLSRLESVLAELESLAEAVASQDRR